MHILSVSQYTTWDGSKTLALYLHTKIFKQTHKGQLNDRFPPSPRLVSDVNKFSTFWDIYWLPWKVTNSNSGWFLPNLGISQKHFHDRDQIYSFEMRGWHESECPGHSSDVLPHLGISRVTIQYLLALVTQGEGCHQVIIVRDRGGEECRVTCNSRQIAGDNWSNQNCYITWHWDDSWLGDVNVFSAVRCNNGVDADIMKHLQLCRDSITSLQSAQCTALTSSNSQTQNSDSNVLY